MTRLSPRTRRVVGRALRAPVALDRPRLRWLLNGLSPAPIVVLVHRGRRTGRIYRTPVEAIVEDMDREIVVSPMWGESSHWYQNVLAGGLVEVRLQGEPHRLEWRLLSDHEKHLAIATYRREHPAYSRLVLRMLVGVHGLAGDPVQAIARALPMLALRWPADPK